MKLNFIAALAAIAAIAIAAPVPLRTPPPTPPTTPTLQHHPLPQHPPPQHQHHPHQHHPQSYIAPQDLWGAHERAAEAHRASAKELLQAAQRAFANDRLNDVYKHHNGFKDAHDWVRHHSAAARGEDMGLGFHWNAASILSEN